MTITLVTGQATGASTAGTSPVSAAFPGNVTAGNIVVVAGFMYTDTVHSAPVAGDCTKAVTIPAGTATLGTITRDVVRSYNYVGVSWLDVVVWSAPVTGSGTLTMQYVTGNSNPFLAIAIAEFNSTNGQIVPAGLSNSNTGTTGTPTSNTITSAGGAQSVFIGSSTDNSGSAGHTWTPSTGTTIYEQEDGSVFETGSSTYRIVNNGTTGAASWNPPSGTFWAAAIVSYKEPTASGSELTLLTTGVGN